MGGWTWRPMTCSSQHTLRGRPRITPPKPRCSWRRPALTGHTAHLEEAPWSAGGRFERRAGRHGHALQKPRCSPPRSARPLGPPGPIPAPPLRCRTPDPAAGGFIRPRGPFCDPARRRSQQGFSFSRLQAFARTSADPFAARTRSQALDVAGRQWFRQIGPARG
ncbi:uncharacterized protein BDZ99DRAFT_132702 [Mytilinidion resinicola]|uniref:Uncharacterized protein n=1 Tax=Mytilinidion resinicola TaxID=574789 RepID=A0A6A6Z7U7_9PEZI|nr:uncharacterized protein BDZ99DRAFT_132702 [Mytilinidion resinicola]KAF2816277.1 hypothetical protein BDZ99DRAFT_132702 [Mytilinidion resinicola]